MSQVKSVHMGTNLRHFVVTLNGIFIRRIQINWQISMINKSSRTIRISDHMQP
jgi:hypothetical protein